MAVDFFAPGAAPVPTRLRDADVEVPGAWVQRHRRRLVAFGLFAVSLIYYGICLYPGVGGTLNAGDSAKFQVLAHAPIMVHGPGYPLYLLLATPIRLLELPVPGWWQIAFALSAVPGALANALAYLIVERATGSTRYALAAALLLGTAHLMAIQATEAEVYALNVAFVLGVVYLLLRFVETERLPFFLAACAVYAISFGNHLMMVSFLPLFLGVTVVYHRQILRPRPIAIVAGFVLLGASQYLYLAYVAHDPATAYSEYMPLPPSANALIHYIIGTYFSGLYGSGLESSRTMEALVETFWKAHPWVAVPLVVAGLGAFLLWGRPSRDAAWRKTALIYAGALCFLPFVLWYGAGDIEAFHLPVLALGLVAAVASIGAAAAARPAMFRGVALVLIAFSLVRAADTGVRLADRQPPFEDLDRQIREIVAQLPLGGERPVLAMGYAVRMAAMYHLFAGDLPRRVVDYRLSWRMPAYVVVRPEIVGAVVPEEALGFVRRVQRVRPELTCRVVPLTSIAEYGRRALAFRCASEVETRKPERYVMQSRPGTSPAPDPASARNAPSPAAGGRARAAAAPSFPG